MDLNFPHVVTALVVALTSIGVFAALWKKRRLENLKPFKELPMPDSSHWLHGHAEIYFATDYLTSVQHLTTAFANEEGLSGNWLGNLPVLCISNYKDARKILLSEYSRRDLGLFERHLKGFGGEKNFLLTNGKEWKTKRDAIIKTFDEDFMMESRIAMKQTTLGLVKSLKAKLGPGNNIVDVQPLMKMVTMDVFGKMAFQTDLGCCENLAPSKLARSFDFLVQEFARRLADPLNPANYFYWIPTPTNIRHRQEKDVLFSFVNDLIEDRRRHKSMDNGSMLSRLMRAQSSLLGESIENVSSRLLFDDIMLLLFAGYDTTSITLMYALYLLAFNPDIQQLCVEELANKCLSDPKELVYCKGVVQEALRLYPPAPQTTRTVSRDKILNGGFVVPKDTYVFISIWSIHRDKTVFPKPLEFRPDRWVKRADTDVSRSEKGHHQKEWVERASMEEPAEEPGCTIAAANHKAFFPFSAGGRSCAGQKFAIEEAVIVLANLLQHFHFSPADPNFKLDIEIRGILQMPKNGIPLIVEQREKSSKE